jgi:hypothetical protein
MLKRPLSDLLAFGASYAGLVAFAIFSLAGVAAILSAVFR